MSLAIENRSKRHEGNGSTTVFPYDFYIASAEDAEVLIWDSDSNEYTTLTSGQYDITGIGSLSYGNVTYPLTGNPLTAGFFIIIRRTVPYTQLTAFTAQEAWTPSTVNNALDRIVMQTQQLADDVSRSMRVAPNEQGFNIPKAVPYGMWRWNAAADAVEYIIDLDLAEFLPAAPNSFYRRSADGTTTDPLTATQVGQAVGPTMDMVKFVADRTAMKANDEVSYPLVSLLDDTTDNQWVWDASIPIATHQTDTFEAIYVAKSAGSDGAYRRQHEGGIWYFDWWRPAYDGTTGAAAKLQAVNDLAALHKDRPRICLITPGNYGLETMVWRNTPTHFHGMQLGDTNTASATQEGATSGVTFTWTGAGGATPMVYDSRISYADFLANTTTVKQMSGGGWSNIRFNGYNGAGGTRATQGIHSSSCKEANYRDVKGRGMTTDVLLMDGGNGIIGQEIDYDVRLETIDQGDATTVGNLGLNAVRTDYVNNAGVTQCHCYGIFGSVWGGSLFEGYSCDNMHFYGKIHAVATPGGIHGRAVTLRNGNNQVRYIDFPYIVGHVYCESNVRGITGHVHEEASSVILEPGADADFKTSSMDSNKRYEPWSFRKVITKSVLNRWSIPDATYCTEIDAPGHGYGKIFQFADNQDGSIEFRIDFDDRVSTGRVVAVHYVFSQTTTNSAGNIVGFKLTAGAVEDAAIITSLTTVAQNTLTVMTYATANKVQHVRHALTTPIPLGQNWAQLVGKVERLGSTLSGSETAVGNTTIHAIALEIVSDGPGSTAFGSQSNRGPWDAPPMLIRGTTSPAYSVEAVRFDGSADYLTRTADLTNSVDGKKGTVSGWIKMMGGDGGTHRIVVNNGGWFDVQRTTGNKISVKGLNAAGSTVLLIQSTATVNVASGWVHFLASWDLANNKAHLYLNGASSVSGTPTIVDDNIDYTRSDWGVGGTVSGGSLLDAEVGALWFDAHTYIDIRDANIRKRFRRADGSPAWLGANGRAVIGASPSLFMDGPLASWHTNRGHGGGFSVTGGALAAAASSPSS